MPDKPFSVPASPSTVVTVPTDTTAQPRRLVTGSVQWRKTLAAFRHRNYRLFFSGQLISLVGTWMQTVAEGWLVYELTHSPFLLGVIRFLNTIPVTVLTLVGGVVADRVDKRRILIATQILAMLLALVLAVLVHAHWVKFWHVAALGLMLGIANAFDIPTRQSFIVDIVGKDDLMNAIALNSSMFNGARIVGPALAGALIGIVGLAGCFFLNGLSFIAVIVGYFLMRLPTVSRPASTQSFWQATREAYRFVRGERVIRTIMIMVAIISLFGWPYTVLMPAFARDILHVGPVGFGWLMAANGFGAFLGAMTLASIGDTPHKRKMFFGGVLGFAVGLAIFAVSTVFWLSAVMLVVSGWCMMISFATANTSVQLRTPDELRGRVMGFYSFAFIGLSPAGSLLAGAVAHWAGPPDTGPRVAVLLGAVICALCAFAIMWLVPPQPKETAS